MDQDKFSELQEKFYKELLTISSDIREIQADIKHQISRDQIETIISQRQDSFNEKLSANRQHADSRIDQTNASLNSRVDNIAEAARELERKLPSLMAPVAASAVKDELKDQNDKIIQARRSLYAGMGLSGIAVMFIILTKTGVL